MFKPYVIKKGKKRNTKIPVVFDIASDDDIKATKDKWASAWKRKDKEYPNSQVYSMKTVSGELISLGRYCIQQKEVTVDILYIESSPNSNPMLTNEKKYHKIAPVMFAFGLYLASTVNPYAAIRFSPKNNELDKYYLSFCEPFEVWGIRGLATYVLDGDAAQTLLDQYQ